MKNLALLISILFTVNTEINSQQISLFGNISIQNSKINTGETQYVSGASIRAFYSKATTSDNYGNFTLEFVGVDKGEPVKLNVFKQGLEVVNKKDLEDVILGRKKNIDIYMSRQGELYENQIAYYQIATDAIEQKYDQKIKKLEVGTKELQKEISRLKLQYKTDLNTKEEIIFLLNKEKTVAIDRAKELSIKFAETNLDNVSEEYIKAFEEYKKGNLDKVLQILNKEVLANNIKKAKIEKENALKVKESADKRISTAEDVINKNVEAALLGARVAQLENRDSSAVEFYLLAINSDSSNIKNVIEFVDYLWSNKKYKVAYRISMKGANGSVRNYDKAKGYMYAGVSANYYGDYSIAEKSLDESLKLFNKSDFIHPKDYSIIANCLNNIGAVKNAAGKYNEAMNYFGKAISIYMQFVLFSERIASENYTNDYQLDTILTNKYLINDKLLDYLIKFYEAEKKYVNQKVENDSIKYDHIIYPSYLEFLVENYQNYEFLATGIFNLGITLIISGKPNEGEKTILDGTHIINSWKGVKKERYLAKKAEAYQMIGNIFENKNQIDKAIYYYKSATMSYLETGNENPNHESVSKIIQSVYTTMNLLLLQNKTDSIKEILDTLINYSEEIRKKELSSSGLLSLALLETYVGMFYLELDPGKAEVVLNSSKNIYLNLIAQDSTNREAKSGLNETLNSIGIYYFNKKEFEKALKNFKESISYFEDCARNQECIATKGQIYTNIGNSYCGLELYSEGESYYNKSLELYENLESENNEFIENKIASTYLNMAILRFNLFKKSEEQELIMEGLELVSKIEKIANKYPYSSSTLRIYQNALWYKNFFEENK